MQELDLPPRHLVEVMSSVQIPPSAAAPHQPEHWCKFICKHRDLFSQTLLCVSSLSQKRFFYFMYATQSPQDIVLAPLEVRRDLKLASSGSFCGAKDVPSLVHCASFCLSVGHYISGRALSLTAEEYMHVIPHAGFGMGTAEVNANSDDAVFFMDFLKGQPESSGPQQQSAGSRSKEQEELLKANPWMQKALSKKQAKAPESEEVEEEEEEEDKKMAADIVADVMARLAAKRHEFQGLHEGPAQHFEVHMWREYAHRGGDGAQGADCARREALSTAQEFAGCTP